MRNKSKIIILCLILCLFASVSTVGATDINDTQYVQENNDLLAVGSVNENLTANNQADEFLNNENSEILGAGEGSFADLKSDIENAAGNTLTLQKDYIFYDSDAAGSIIVKENFKIIGDNHIIDANGKSSIFTIEGNNVTLDGIVFKNAYCLDKNGAAIYWYGNNGNISGCTFNNNSVLANNGLASYGGAIFWYGKNAYIKNSKFINNSALSHQSSGGAIYFSQDCDNVTVINSQFMDNSAAYAGGAIYIQNVKAKINNSQFNTSKSNGDGGAIYYVNYKDSVDILNCNFAENSASRTGSAIYGEITNSTVYNCVFKGRNPMYFSSESDNAIINLTNNTELSKYNGHVVENNARLYLKGNTFKTSIHNMNTIISQVTPDISIKDAARSSGNIYHYNNPEGITVIIKMRDDKKNVIVCDYLKFMDSKEGLYELGYENVESDHNEYEYSMRFVGQHVLSIVDDIGQFEKLKNDSAYVRVDGSYDNLMDLIDYYTIELGVKDVILEGNIRYNASKDSYTDLPIDCNLIGKLWGYENLKVTISGSGEANGFIPCGDKASIKNLFISGMSNKINSLGGGVAIFCQYSDNFAVINCEIYGGDVSETEDWEYSNYKGTSIWVNYANNFTLINSTVYGYGEDSSAIYADGSSDFHIINTSFLSGPENGYFVEINGLENILLENITISTLEFTEGILIHHSDKIKIKGVNVNLNEGNDGVYDKVIHISESENILVDGVKVRCAPDISYFYDSRGVYIYSPTPIMLFETNTTISNLTISNSECWNGVNAFIFLNSPVDYYDYEEPVISANISNIYVHDMSSQILRPMRGMAESDIGLNLGKLNGGESSIFSRVGCVVNLTDSRFYNNVHRSAVWAQGPLYTSNCSFINNTGYFDEMGTPGPHTDLNETYNPFNPDYFTNRGYPLHINYVGNGGYGTNYWYGMSGAAIVVSNYLESVNNTFINNYNCLGHKSEGLDYGGGAISYRKYYYIINGVESTGWSGIVDGCTFINNTATNGGAIYVQSSDSVMINNSRFIGNDAEILSGSEWYYAVYKAPVEDNIDHHIMTGHGGAIFIRCENQNKVVINNCSFDDNAAFTSGAAIASAKTISGVYGDPDIYVDTPISIAGGNGGSQFIVNDSVFTNNTIIKRLGSEVHNYYNLRYYKDTTFPSVGPNYADVYPNVIDSQIGYTNITNNVFDNNDMCHVLINSSGNVYIENNAEINNMTNRTFDSYDAIYSIVLLNGLDYFSNNTFNNSIFFKYGEPINDNHEFMTHVTITYMENKTVYIMIDNEGWVNLTATIFDDNNNVVVSNTGFLFTDNYTSITNYQDTVDVSYNPDGWDHIEYTQYTDVVYHNYDGVYWNYTHITLPIRGYKVIPKNTTLGKFSNSTIGFKDYVPSEYPYNRLIHDFRNATVYNATLVKMPYCYMWLQQQFDKAYTINWTKYSGYIGYYHPWDSFEERLIEAQFFGSWMDQTTGEMHIIFNLIHNITFFPDYDLWDGNGYKDIINFTNGMLLNYTMIFNGHSPFAKEFNYGISHSSADPDSFTFTISGDNQARIFNVTANIDIDRMNFINSTSNSSGGAFYITNSNVSLNDASFSNISSNSSGGVIFLKDSKLSGDMYFYNSTALDYGGILYSQDSTINASIKTLNSTAYSGGAIYLNNSKLDAEILSCSYSVALNGSGGVIYAI